MKQSIWVIAMIVAMSGIYGAGCAGSSERVKASDQDIVGTHRESDDANRAHKSDMDEYRKKSADQFAANERSIADFNARAADQISEARADYQKRVSDLNTRNNDMKRKLDNYKSSSKSNWDTFKADFSREMDELGGAFRDFTGTTGNENKQ